MNNSYILYIYTIEYPHKLLYNTDTKKLFLSVIEKVLTNKSWKDVTASDICIEDDSKVLLHFRKSTEYLYILITKNKYISKIYSLFNDLINLIEFEKITFSNSIFVDKINQILNPIDKINQINNQVEELKNTMVDTISLTLDRSTKLSNLENKSNELKDASINFENKSLILKRKKRWQNIKISLITGFIIIIVVIIIVIIASSI